MVKNSTFFFGNYESLHENQGLTQLGTVPTAAVRAGDLSSVGGAVDPFTEIHLSDGIIPDIANLALRRKGSRALSFSEFAGRFGKLLSNPIQTNRQNEEASV